ncbi:MAG: crotonase/enoyl-CoA hydratase family protein [Aeromicrobium sp.]|uniref:crotonase/enoyl-CoA hydratase family protein n=1 Tax=Aeromicrobium sp. TaxID=1871063 RepID=UPI003C69D9AF
MSEPRVLTTIDGPVAHVTLNRPEQLNGVDLDLIDDLLATANTLRKNRAIRAVILQGSGRSFCAGLDFAAAFKNKRRVARYFFAGARTVNRFQKFSTVWRDLPVPVIAVVHGHCYGAGVQLAAGADFRITTPDAQWAILEAKWGLVPDMGGTVPFIENLPIDSLQRLAMTGEVISGAQAVELGLASMASEDPMAEAMDFVAKIIERSPDSVAATKALLYANQRGSRRAALRMERRMQAQMFKTPNTAIAREAGMSKRSASFGPRTFG